MVGADVEKLRQFGTYLQNQLGSDLTTAFNRATQQIPQIQWAGNDAQQFVTTWNQMLSQIANVFNQTFDSLSQAITSQAQQQQDTSAS